MSNNLHESTGKPRQPSPSSFEAASGLLKFISTGPSPSSTPQHLPPSLAKASLVNLPPTLASNPNSTAPSSAFLAAQFMPTMQGTPQMLPHSFLMHDATMQVPATTAPIAATSMKTEGNNALPVNCTADGKITSTDTPLPTRRPCINRPIDHSYTDYAPVSDAELRLLDQDDTILNSPEFSPHKRELMRKLREMPSKSGAMALSFPSKLHEVVSNPDLAAIISWLPHGRCFLVHNIDALVQEVLPKFFNQTKFLSFIRQLNLWGFKRLTRGVEGKAYYHELFLRGRPYMSLRLKRMKVKGHGFKPIPNPMAEPNFYTYTDVGGAPTAEAGKMPPKFERSKKQIVLSRASSDENVDHPSQIFGLGGTLQSKDAVQEKPKSVPKAFVAEATASASNASPRPADEVQPAAAVNPAPMEIVEAVENKPTQAPTVKQAHDKEGSLKPAPKTEGLLEEDELAILNYRRAAVAAAESHGRLSGLANYRTSPEDRIQAEAAAAAQSRFAAMADLENTADRKQGGATGALASLANSYSSNSAHYAALMRLSSSVRNASDFNSGMYHAVTSQPKMDDILVQRLAQLRGEQGTFVRNPFAYSARSNMDDLLSHRLLQLQREQKEIELLRRACAAEDLSAQAQFSQRSPSLRATQAFSGNTNRLSVAEAIREANHLEELAAASRNRARMLALAGAMEPPQAGYDRSGSNQGNDQADSGETGN